MCRKSATLSNLLSRKGCVLSINPCLKRIAFMMAVLEGEGFSCFAMR